MTAPRQGDDQERLERDLRVRERQQAAVATLGQRALAGLDLPSLMNEAVALVAERLDVECAGILELVPTGQAFILRTGVGWAPGVVGAATVGAGNDSQAGFTLRAGHSVIVHDLNAETRFQPPALLKDHEVVSGMTTIVPGRQRPFGVLGAHTRRRRDFTVDDVHFLEAVANVLAAAIEADAAQRRLTFLAEASTVLSASLDYDVTLKSLSRLAVPDLADWCVVDVRGDDGSIRRVAVAHLDPARETLGWEFARRWPLRPDAPEGVPNVLRTGKAELYSDVGDALLSAVGRHQEYVELLRAIGLRSAMLVPLVARDRTLGVISFGTAESGRRYGPADLVLAEDLARRAALAFDNACLYQEVATANRAKDEFLAILSHELRTPLTAILGWARMLRAGKLDSAAAERALETIERNARTQSTLINDLLDISRIVTGNFALEIRAVDAAQVVEAALQSVRPLADSKEIRLEADVARPAGSVAGDPDRLQQVVWNLLTNAIKFTPAGGVVGVVLESDGGHVRIRVRDTGPGLNPDFLPHIFEPFRQADSSLTRVHGGLGLGLAIVRHLVEMHGGRVHADSPGPGQGSTFTVELPVTRAQPAPRSVEPPGTPTLGSVRVLVVDDEADTREMVVTALAQFGAETRATGSVAEALVTLRSWRPDVLVADIGMPDEDGYALIGQIRALPAPASDIPSIALTAHARPEDRQRALAAGYQVHVAKPVEPVELARAVGRLAPRRRR